MFCQKCGTKNEKGVKFCATCGAEIVDNQPPQSIVQSKRRHAQQRVSSDFAQKGKASFITKIKALPTIAKILPATALVLIVVVIALVIMACPPRIEPVRKIEKAEKI